MSRKLIALTAVLLTFALLFGFAGCSLIPEGEEETTTTVNVKTPLPTDVTSSKDENGNIITDTDYSPEALAKNTATVFEYFNKVINEVKGKKAALNYSTRPDIGQCEDEEGNRIPYCENEYIAAAITGLKSKMVKGGSTSIPYGQEYNREVPIKDTLFVSKLDAKDIESATCVDDGAVRTITVNLKNPVEKSTLNKAFDQENMDTVLSEFRKAEKYLKVDEPEITYDDCSIIITVNIETDEVTQIRYEKSADVSTKVTGTGTLESIGEQTVRFMFYSTTTYNLDYTDPDATAIAES